MGCEVRPGQAWAPLTAHFALLFCITWYLCLGVIKDDSFLSEMIKEATGPINFTMFLTFMGDKLQNTDTDDVLVSAFLTIDSENTGFINKMK